MNVGKTLFTQVMEYVPWKTFGRIVERHQGDAGVHTLGCADLFRVMVFAQLTWRESLRDIEACLAANRNKLFHMGMKAPPARSTLSDAAAHLKPGGVLIVEIGHNRAALEKAFPKTPFTWLETSAGDGHVFLLRREELP